MSPQNNADKPGERALGSPSRPGQQGEERRLKRAVRRDSEHWLQERETGSRLGQWEKGRTVVQEVQD